jgi:hypothetical protein
MDKVDGVMCKKYLKISSPSRVSRQLVRDVGFAATIFISSCSSYLVLHIVDFAAFSLSFRYWDFV